METYICNCIEYLKSNEMINWIVTVLSVIASAFFSWLFARIYYNKSNNNQAKATIIKPLINRAKDTRPSIMIYNEMVEVTEKYEYAFLSKKEQKIVQDFLWKYNDYLKYSGNDNWKSSILYDYFLQKLDEMNVWYTVEEIYDHETNEHIEWVEPSEFHQLENRITEVLKYHVYSERDFNLIKLRDDINDLFNKFWSIVENHKNIDFFENTNVDTVIKNSAKYKDAMMKIQLYIESKKELENLIK